MHRVLLTLSLSCIVFWLVFSAIPAARATRDEKSRNIAVQSSASSATRAVAVTYTYYSSVDGAALEYMEYLPAGYTASITYPLAIMLPGAGGNYQYNNGDWQAAANTYGFILVTVRPRLLPGYGTYRGTFYIDGALVPGEQDVMDALADEQARRWIDPARIYIAGYSMGGIGALKIATLYPGVFAAAAPGAPISDLFQEAAYSSTIPVPNFATLLGGAPGQSAITDTHWYLNSPRFLLPNLMHTPIRVLHGISDTFIPNATAIWPYMQSRHIVDTPGFVDSRGQATTLQELAAAWPGSFYEEHVWPNAEHGPASLSYAPTDVLAFLDAHPLITNPITVAFTTYEDRHTRAYWLKLNLTRPWTAMPGQVYATRNPAGNSVQLQVAGSMTLTLDMTPMGLTSVVPLAIVAQPISPAAQVNELAVVLSGAWPFSATGVYSVTRDGTPLSPISYTFSLTRFTLLRQPVETAHTYIIWPASLTNLVYLPLILR
jgi:pimeloyl-ACP methyl ester carboxylesterase